MAIYSVLENIKNSKEYSVERGMSHPTFTISSTFVFESYYDFWFHNKVLFFIHMAPNLAGNGEIALSIVNINSVSSISIPDCYKEPEKILKNNPTSIRYTPNDFKNVAYSILNNMVNGKSNFDVPYTNAWININTDMDLRLDNVIKLTSSELFARMFTHRLQNLNHLIPFSAIKDADKERNAVDEGGSVITPINVYTTMDRLQIIRVPLMEIFQTNIPSFAPPEVIYAAQSLIVNKNCIPCKPWYSGYTYNRGDIVRARYTDGTAHTFISLTAYNTEIPSEKSSKWKLINYTCPISKDVIDAIRKEANKKD